MSNPWRIYTLEDQYQRIRDEQRRNLHEAKSKRGLWRTVTAVWWGGSALYWIGHHTGMALYWKQNRLLILGGQLVTLAVMCDTHTSYRILKAEQRLRESR
jgi:hypothetical protein